MANYFENTKLNNLWNRLVSATEYHINRTSSGEIEETKKIVIFDGAVQTDGSRIYIDDTLAKYLFDRKISITWNGDTDMSCGIFKSSEFTGTLRLYHDIIFTGSPYNYYIYSDGNYGSSIENYVKIVADEEIWGPVNVDLSIFKGDINFDGSFNVFHTVDAVKYDIIDVYNRVVMSGGFLNYDDPAEIQNHSLTNLSNGKYTIKCVDTGSSYNDILNKTATLIIGDPDKYGSLPEAISLENTGIKGIHDALLPVFNLKHDNIPTKMGDYLCGISQAARTNANQTSDRWYINSLVKDDNFVFDYDNNTLSLSNSASISAAGIYSIVSGTHIGNVTRDGYNLSNLDIPETYQDGYYIQYGSTTLYMQYGRARYDLEEMLESSTPPPPTNEVYLDDQGILHANIGGSGTIAVSLYWKVEDVDVIRTDNEIFDLSNKNINLSKYMYPGEQYYVSYYTHGTADVVTSGTTNTNNYSGTKGTAAWYVDVTLSSALTAKINTADSMYDVMYDMNVTILDQTGNAERTVYYTSPFFDIYDGVYFLGYTMNSTDINYYDLVKGNTYSVKCTVEFSDALNETISITKESNSAVYKPCVFSIWQNTPNLINVRANSGHSIKQVEIWLGGTGKKFNKYFTDNPQTETVIDLIELGYTPSGYEEHPASIVNVLCGSKDTNGVEHNSFSGIDTMITVAPDNMIYWIDASGYPTQIYYAPDLGDEWCYEAGCSSCGASFYISSSYYSDFQCPSCSNEFYFMIDASGSTVNFYGSSKDYFYKDSIFGSAYWSTDGEVDDNMYYASQYWQCYFCGSKHYPFYSGGEYIPDQISSCNRCGQHIY